MYNDAGDAHWLLGSVASAAGQIRKIKTTLEAPDILGSVKVRLGINRNKYRVSPGLYAVGNPNDKSPVLVTANYKLTFDSLRKELVNQNLWILVLDTRGINVWCAAGKGTFGTQELIQRINHVKLDKIVSHKTLILPQLGAPGVAAHEVTKSTGFKVVYGPVRAMDIPEFLHKNLKATQEMRRVQFALKDRLILTPLELNFTLKYIPIIFILLLLINFINPGAVIFTKVLYQSTLNLAPFLLAILVGTIGVPALLPYIPFRSFALKGLVAGAMLAAVIARYNSYFLFPESNLIIAANSLFIVSITSYLGLNFTGSTTYTSLSGVEKETLYTVPLVLAATVIGLGLIITYKVLLF